MAKNNLEQKAKISILALDELILMGFGLGCAGSHYQHLINGPGLLQMTAE